MSKLVQRAYYSMDTQKKRPHYHDSHQIILITKGEVEFCINGKTQKAREGSIIIFSRYENHSLSVLSQNYERYVLRLSPQISNIENKVYSLLLNRPQGFCNAIEVSGALCDFQDIFCRIIKEYERAQKLSDNMQELLINELLIMIYRRLPDTSYFDEQNTEMVYALQRRLEGDFSRQYSLSALAKEYNISASSLSHQFKKLTGSSVMDYLLSCRMAMAKNYLSKTNFSISEIVEKCGFSDCSNFSRTFKKLNGISPRDFRKKYAAE